MSSSSPPRRRVSIEENRREFNPRNYRAQAAAGLVVRSVAFDKRMADQTCTDKGYPLGTRKQMIADHDGAVRVALAHLVVLPDGSFGGSGLEDPKELLVDGVLWFV